MVDLLKSRYAEEIKKLKEALDKRKAGQVGGGDSKKKEKKNQYFTLLFIKIGTFQVIH